MVDPLIVTSVGSLIAGDGVEARVTVTIPLALLRLMLVTASVYVALLMLSALALSAALVVANGVLERLAPAPQSPDAPQQVYSRRGVAGLVV